MPPLAGSGRLALTREELESWGERFGRAVQAPLVVTLAGDLGAGKTTLVQAICRGFGVRDAVSSPTYALVHEYASPRGAVFLLVLSRLDDEREREYSGWDDVLRAHALVLIEWPERAAARLPRAHVPIDLEHLPGDESRRVLLAG